MDDKVIIMKTKKHLILIAALVMAILMIGSATAAFYTDFRTPRAVCTEKGLEILTSHNGRVIDSTEIKVSTQDAFGATYDVKGKWYIDDQPVYYIRGNSPLDDTEVKFVAETPFPKNENYRIFFSYKRTEDANDYTTLQFIANCPGKLCSTDINCADSETCTGGQCKALDCNSCQKPYMNACVPKCVDGNVCTKDICREGVCSYDSIPSCCASAKDCDDKSVCTTDACTNQRCEHTPIVCKGTEACVTGACQEGLGCVYENNLTCLNEENRRYVLQLGEPKVVERESRPTNILSWILTFLKNFFG